MYWWVCFPILWIVFLFCWWFSLLCKTFLVWCSPIYLFFLLFLLHGELYLIKYCYKQYLIFYWLFFSSRIFMVWDLTFKSLIHFELIHVCDITRWSGFIFLHLSDQFSHNCLLSKLSLAHCMCWLPLLNINWL